MHAQFLSQWRVSKVCLVGFMQLEQYVVSQAAKRSRDIIICQCKSCYHGEPSPLHRCYVLQQGLGAQCHMHAVIMLAECLLQAVDPGASHSA